MKNIFIQAQHDLSELQYQLDLHGLNSHVVVFGQNNNLAFISVSDLDDDLIDELLAHCKNF